jgi:ribA/ribD-fused uncharacterized protein
MNLVELRAAIEHGQRFEFTFFYGHAARSGPVGTECFSQWYPSPFTVDGHRYPTAEHFMMAEKARLFGDDATRLEILAAATPAEAKALGRRVRGFHDTTWEAHRLAIVVAGNLAKFGRHPELAEVLRATGERVLVEASPRDRIWGIGLGVRHPDAHDPGAWRGQNLLGFALMDIRARLPRPPAVRG